MLSFSCLGCKQWGIPNLAKMPSCIKRKGEHLRKLLDVMMLLFLCFNYRDFDGQC